MMLTLAIVIISLSALTGVALIHVANTIFPEDVTLNDSNSAQ